MQFIIMDYSVSGVNLEEMVSTFQSMFWSSLVSNIELENIGKLVVGEYWKASCWSLVFLISTNNFSSLVDISLLPLLILELQFLLGKCIFHDLTARSV